MKNFISALGFLTIIPTPENSFQEDGKQIIYFPLVGLLIGAMLCVIDNLASTWSYGEIRVITDIIFLAVISGALHLDGLADSADGLFSHRSKEKALEIMKDPSIGTMGTLALIFGILLKFSGLKGINGNENFYWLLAVPACARTGQIVGLVFMDYARTDANGKSTIFFQKRRYELLVLGLIPLAIPFMAGIYIGLTVLGIFLIITLLSLWYFNKKIGGITGDSLGALTELLEISLFTVGGIVCTNFN